MGLWVRILVLCTYYITNYDKTIGDLLRCYRLLVMYLLCSTDIVAEYYYVFVMIYQQIPKLLFVCGMYSIL